MSWADAARQKRLAPIGAYRPEPYRVVVHDTFQQFKLRMAARTFGLTVPAFLLFAAEYTIAHHRELRHFAAVFRKGAREIAAAASRVEASPHSSNESQRDRLVESALDRFSGWATPKLMREGEPE
jgi:hypothetical protein